MTKQDLSKIDVPKSIRLNMNQRNAIAARLADNAKTKAIEEHDDEAISKDLTERLLAAMWQSTELRAAAENMPDDFFPTTDRVNVAILNIKEHETGVNGEKTKYVSVDNMTFFLSVDDKVLIPYALKSYLAVAPEQGEKIDKWKADHENYTTIHDKDLERDLAHHLQFKSRVVEAERTLRGKAMQTLRQVKSVKELQENWIAAFEVYHDLYEGQLRGKSLVPAAPISAVSQMISDFPDISDVMAA